MAEDSTRGPVSVTVAIGAHEFHERSDRVGRVIEHGISTIIGPGLTRPCAMATRMLDRHVVIITQWEGSGCRLKPHRGEVGRVALTGE